MKKTKWFALFWVIVIAISTVGCTKSGGNNTSSNSMDESAGTENAANNATVADTEEVDSNIWDPYGKYEQPVAFTMGRQSVQGSNLPETDTLDNNEYTKYIEKKLNIKIINNWEVDSTNYEQKVNLSISSNDLPDVMIVNEKQLKALVEADLIEDLTEVFNKTASPLVKGYYDSYGDRAFNSSTFDGKIMALPNLNPSNQEALLWVRKDWLDKLGLQPPKTLDDVVAVAKAFVENDPDGNNEKDTVGIAVDATVNGTNVVGIYNSISNLDPIFGAYQSFPKQWMKDSSGTIVYGSITPETKAALAKVHDMYAAGLIDKEFVVRKTEDVNGLYASGKSGMFFGPWWVPYYPLPDSVKNDPKADWQAYLAPLDAKGKYNIYMPNPHGQYLVVKKGYAHPEAIMKVLNVEVDGIRLLDPESKDLYKGLNVSWQAWPFNIQLDYDDALLRNYQVLKKAIDAKDPSALTDEFKGWYEDILKNIQDPGKDEKAWENAQSRWNATSVMLSDQIQIHQNASFSQTKTMETKWANLRKLEDETFLKIIMGDKKIDEFDSFVSQWKKLGGDEITKEMNDEVNKK